MSAFINWCTHYAHAHTKGGAVLTFIASAVSLPIAHLAFALNWPLLPRTKLHWEDGLALVIILAGLIVYAARVGVSAQLRVGIALPVSSRAGRQISPMRSKSKVTEKRREKECESTSVVIYASCVLLSLALLSCLMCDHNIDHLSTSALDLGGTAVSTCRCQA